MIYNIHLKGNAHQRRVQRRMYIRSLKSNEELVEDKPTQLILIHMIQIELTKKDRCYVARARIYGRVRCKSPKFRKWSAAIDYCVAWLQTNWKDEVL